MNVDVALLAALPEEHAALEEMLKNTSITKTIRHQGNWGPYLIHTLHGGARVVLTQPVSMGQLNAATETGRLLYDLHPRVIVLGGIAGCMQPAAATELKLGDVIVGEQIIDYEPAKIRDSGQENRGIEFACCLPLIQFVKERKARWDSKTEKLPPRPVADQGWPQVHTGNVFSGSKVVASEAAKQALLEKQANVIAIEMEAAGIAAMLRAMRMPERFLMVKSFTDWADGTKNDEWRKYACDVSAAFIRFLLRDIVPDYLRRFDAAKEDRDLFRSRIDYAFRSFLGVQAASIPFVHQMSDAIREQAIAETCNLTALSHPEKQRYRAQVGAGYQFLLRARPFFSNAKRIFATSVDSVSTFWLDPKNRRTACEYINTHAADHPNNSVVMRLFAFSTPENAHNHSKVLDYHAKRFPNTLVCSQQSYQQHLHRIAPTAREKYSTRDFAIIECSTDSGDEMFFADLDADTFTIGAARLNDETAPVDCLATIDLFNELAQTEPGVFDPRLKVLKWDINHWRDRAAGGWADSLASMFGEPAADVFHLVAFNITAERYDDLRSVLAEIKYQILDAEDPAQTTLAKKYGVKDVWLAKQNARDQISLIDDTTGGKLWYDETSAMSYILLMKFADREKLASFMRSPEHLKMRLRVFAQFEGPLREMMREFAIAEPQDFQSHGKKARVLYETLETLAASSMRRYDYLEDELISEIVLLKPPAFP